MPASKAPTARVRPTPKGAPAKKRVTQPTTAKTVASAKTTASAKTVASAKVAPARKTAAVKTPAAEASAPARKTAPTKTARAATKPAPATKTRATPKPRASGKTRPVTKAVPVAPEVAPKRGLSPSHKDALAAGREAGNTVRRYIAALSRPKRPGRKRSIETVERDIAKVNARVRTSPAAERPALVANRDELKAELAYLRSEAHLAIDDLTAAFVAVAAGYGRRKGMSYSDWRTAGVSPDVLRKAGINRAGN